MKIKRIADDTNLEVLKELNEISIKMYGKSYDARDMHPVQKGLIKRKYQEKD